MTKSTDDRPALAVSLLVTFVLAAISWVALLTAVSFVVAAATE